MYTDEYEYDVLFADDEILYQIAGQFGTPYYLYSEAGIAGSFSHLHQCFGWHSGFQQFFPANFVPFRQMCRILHRFQDGLMCSTLSELQMAKEEGFTAQRVLFSPMLPTTQELQLAKELDASVTIDNLASLKLLLEQYRPKRVYLRLNVCEKIRVGAIAVVRSEKTKLGMTQAELFEAAQILQTHGIESIGLEMKNTNMVMEDGFLAEVLRYLLQCAAKLKTLGIHVDCCNIGGGVGANYKPGMQEPSMQAVAQKVQAVYEEQCQALGLDGIQIQSALGRFLIAHHAILVSKVLLCKSLEREFVILDAASNADTRSSINAYHHVSVAGKRQRQNRSYWDVAGNWPSSTDRFAERRILPDLAPGDLCVIHDVGVRTSFSARAEKSRVLYLLETGAIEEITL